MAASRCTCATEYATVERPGLRTWPRRTASNWSRWLASFRPLLHPTSTGRLPWLAQGWLPGLPFDVCDIWASPPMRLRVRGRRASKGARHQFCSGPCFNEVMPMMYVAIDLGHYGQNKNNGYDPHNNGRAGCSEQGYCSVMLHFSVPPFPCPFLHHAWRQRAAESCDMHACLVNDATWHVLPWQADASTHVRSMHHQDRDALRGHVMYLYHHCTCVTNVRQHNNCTGSAKLR